MPTAVSFESGSYRDRDGRVFRGPGGEIYRALSARALIEWDAVSATGFFQQAMARGAIVGSEQVDAAPAEFGLDSSWAGILKHEEIPFVSYPYEWTFGMLKDAALAHLELLKRALEEDLTIKDGTAYNMQWVGTRPVFIDVASFERLKSGRPWDGYRQFCQTFLYPLILQAHKNVDFHALLRGRLEGISPSDCARLISMRDLFRPGVFTHVWLHSRLEGSRIVRESGPQQGLERAGFDKTLIERNVANLARTIRRLSWSPAHSPWSAYAGCVPYSADDQRRKASFVAEVVFSRRWDLVWDLGCNTGEYSRIASENARYVVAMDSDHLAVERLYQSLQAQGKEARPVEDQSPGGRRLNGQSPDRPTPGERSPAAERRRTAGAIVPLVVNIADPSPNLGWRGHERGSLTARGLPDLTLCLALVHHLVIGAGIPLRDLLEWLAELGTNLVIEFITKDDPMVRQLLKNRKDSSPDYELDLFEGWLSRFFVVNRSERLASGTRTLYYAMSRSPK
ncbi:MAG TPA: hypothetical protein VKU82_11565 [Planctomycetaceae bacterium]|nr:hypothetical protein [Planctomycetaceae bacterium]